MSPDIPLFQLDKPDVFISDKVKWQHAQSAIRELGEIALSAAADHVSAADNSIHRQDLFGLAGLPYGKPVLPFACYRRDNFRIFELERLPIELTDDSLRRRLSAGVSVCRFLPRIVFVFMTLPAFILAGEIVESDSALLLYAPNGWKRDYAQFFKTCAGFLLQWRFPLAVGFQEEDEKQGN